MVGEMPKLGDRYCYITSHGYIQEVHWKNDDFDLLCYEIGNCFKTKEDAKEFLEKIKEIRDELNTKM